MIKISRGRIIFAVVIVALLLAVQWLSSRTFISVSAPSEGTELTYVFVNQDTNSTTEVVSSAKQVKKLLRTGSYEVYVQGETESYATVRKTKGFLSTTSIQANLKKEKSRQFAGENAAPCTNYINDRLYSYECDGALNTVTEHVPAAQAQPSYTLSANISSPASVESTAYTDQGTVVLTGFVFRNEEELLTDYSLGILSDKFSITNRVEVSQLSFDKKYELKEYRQGFLLFATDLSEVYYYAGVGSNPETFELKGPKDDSLNPVGLSVKNEQIITYYSSVDENDDIHEVTDATSEIVIHDTDNTTYYSLDIAITDLELCGSRLCAISDKTLSVYQLGKSQLESLYEIGNTFSLENISGSIFVTTDRGVLDLDADTQTAAFSYSFGGYSWCGLQRAASGYSLCVIDSNNNMLTLLVDNSRPVTNIHDKRLLKLQKSPDIESASMYKNIVFITPKLTAKANSTQPQRGVYSEEQIERSQKIISESVAASGFTDSEVVIINTANPY